MAIPPAGAILITGTDVNAQIALLKHRLWQERRAAATRLEKLKDKVAVPALIEALTDENYYVRLTAARALGKLGDARAVDGLVLLLADHYNLVRYTALWALGELGPLAKAALPAIEPFLSDPAMLPERENTVKDLAALVKTLIEKEPAAAPAAPVEGELSAEERKLKREIAMAKKKAREAGQDEEAAAAEVTARFQAEMGAKGVAVSPAGTGAVATEVLVGRRNIPSLDQLPELPPLESVLPLSPEDRAKRREIALMIRAAKRRAKG